MCKSALLSHTEYKFKGHDATSVIMEIKFCRIIKVRLKPKHFDFG